MSGFFEAPAYKLEIADLLNARDENDDGCWTLTLRSDTLPSGSSNVIPLKEKKLRLNIIWIQGVVIDILGDGRSPSTLHLMDGSNGKAFLHEYNLLPGGDHPKIAKGAYVGVLGQIWSTDPTIVIKGAKVMCLEENPIVKQLWQDEVTTAKAFLLDILCPDLAS